MKKIRAFLSLLLAVLMTVGVFGSAYAATETYTLLGVDYSVGCIQYESAGGAYFFSDGTTTYIWKDEKSPSYEDWCPSNYGIYNDAEFTDLTDEADFAANDTFYYSIAMVTYNDSVNISPEADKCKLKVPGFETKYIGLKTGKNGDNKLYRLAFKIKKAMPLFTLTGLDAKGSGISYSEELGQYRLNDADAKISWKNNAQPPKTGITISAVYTDSGLYALREKDSPDIDNYYIGIGLPVDEKYPIITESAFERSRSLSIDGYITEYCTNRIIDGKNYYIFQLNKKDDTVYTASGVHFKASGIQYEEAGASYYPQDIDYKFAWKDDIAPSASYYCPTSYSTYADAGLKRSLDKGEFNDKYIFYTGMGVTPLNPEICHIAITDEEKDKCTFDLPGYNTEFVKTIKSGDTLVFVFKFYKDGAVDFPLEPEEMEPKDRILAFVERIYTYVLDREPEADGAAFWSDELYAFRRTGAEVAQGFIFSPEFENRKTSDRDFVTILYKTFFGRDPEEDGMNFWLSQLSSGTMDRVAVANGFIFSQEWANTCATYGIRSGGDIKPDCSIDPTDLTYEFVERMYTTAMGREYDEEGKYYWASELSNFNITGEGCGVSFFLSAEMEGYKLSDKEFLGRLYATFMNRDADADGEAYWLGVMSSGATRSDVVLGFTRSAEFVDKCVEARILPY